MPRLQQHMSDSYHSDVVTDMPLVSSSLSSSNVATNQHQLHHMPIPQHTTDMGYSSPRINNEWFGQYGNPLNTPLSGQPQRQQQQPQQQQQHMTGQQMSQYGEPMIDPNFEPQSRVRSNTWPIRPPSSKVDTSVKQEPIVEISENECTMAGITDSSSHVYSATGHTGELTSEHSLVKMCQSPDAAGKKAGSRRNAWGNLSYAELITKAIQASPEQRLTLSQVYEWMVQNVTYFKDKGDSNSSAGWKVR